MLKWPNWALQVVCQLLTLKRVTMKSYIFSQKSLWRAIYDSNKIAKSRHSLVLLFSGCAFKRVFKPHRKKSFSVFPSPAGMSLTKLSLGGNIDVIHKLFPPRESLVSDIPAGDSNIEQLFLQCTVQLTTKPTISLFCHYKQFLYRLCLY